MSSIRTVFVRAARTPGVRKVRRTAGRFGAPGLNPEFEALRREIADTSARFDRHMPPVLNAIASTNGTARLLRREVDHQTQRLDGEIGRIEGEVARIGQVASAGVARLDGEVARIDGDVARLNGHIRDELWPLMSRAEALEPLNETVAWLLQRVETVRAEMLHELRYGHARSADQIDTEVVNPSAIRTGDV